MMYAIDDDIPIPTMEVGRPRKYPFPYLRGGDSFFTNEPRDVVRYAAKSWKRNHNTSIEFIFRSVVENGIAGTRVWRIS